ncbi:hypothetical protein BU17DRAFT_65975 [Hysterangium stoloniferum]|nr:hypothetical protein BU17DRAFT_65975 [Hysterangium stoloniferum]
MIQLDFMSSLLLFRQDEVTSNGISILSVQLSVFVSSMPYSHYPGSTQNCVKDDSGSLEWHESPGCSSIVPQVLQDDVVINALYPSPGQHHFNKDFRLSREGEQYPFPYDERNDDGQAENHPQGLATLGVEPRCKRRVCFSDGHSHLPGGGKIVNTPEKLECAILHLGVCPNEECQERVPRAATAYRPAMVKTHLLRRPECKSFVKDSTVKGYQELGKQLGYIWPGQKSQPQMS